MLTRLKQRLKELDGLKIQIRGEGEYPVKARTKVQHVAVYQNDGTATIKPARFVQRAARRHRYWQMLVFRAAGRYMTGHGLGRDFNQAGLRIAYDINNAVNRIRTGRLKKSFRPHIKRAGRAGPVVLS